MLDGTETSLPDVCMHPEYGICLTRRMRYEQKPYSWRRVAWRAPALPENPTSINSMDDRGLARLGGVLDHLYTYVSASLHAGLVSRKHLGRVKSVHRAEFHRQMMIGQWTGTIVMPSVLHMHGPTCRFRLQDRIGRWSLQLDTMSGRKNIMMIDILPDEQTTPVTDPMRIMNRMMEMFGAACLAPRYIESEMHERNETIGHRLMCSVLSQGDHWPVIGIAGHLTPAGQGLARDIAVTHAKTGKGTTAVSLSPELQEILRTMIGIDMEYRTSQSDDFYWARLGTPYWLEYRADTRKPSAMEILRNTNNEDGSPQVLDEPDPTPPSHPPTEWLVPLKDAAMIGDARMRRLAAEYGATR